MGEAAHYAASMRKNDIDECLAIEEKHGLVGLPPELVSLALTAIDEGNDPWEALDRATQASEQH